MDKLKCERCDNTDPTYFYLGSKGYYCRKCIGFGPSLDLKDYESNLEDSLEIDYQLPFELSECQKQLSKQVLNNYRENNILVYAACGAGKTEIVLEMIKDCKNRGLNIGWAIPRRSVVLQLTERLNDYFRELKVVAVCEGYTNEVVGDLIVCTTHQLYRYTNYFDYLIIDEPDAFPFKNNTILQNIAVNSVKEKIIFLTATPDAFVKEHSDLEIKLFKRAHGYPIIVPRIIKKYILLDYYYLNKMIYNNSGKLIIFVPTIKLAKRLYQIYKMLVNCQVITSKSSDKERVLKEFISTNKMVLFSTTILERGVTIEGVNVLIFRANHPVFDLASLIQMTGRVGRTFKHPTGEATLMINQESLEVAKCVYLLKEMNDCA